MSQDGRYKNFACRQRLVQNPNYVDQESKSSIKTTGISATSTTASSNLSTVKTLTSGLSSSSASTVNSSSFNQNISHANGPSSLTNSNLDSNISSTLNSSHQNASNNNSNVNSTTNTNVSNSLMPEHGQHRLQYRYNLWFSRRLPGKLTSSQFYDQTLKLLATFGTVEQFWSIYSYLLRPSDLPGHFDFHLFKDGIKPMWEDEANKRGGKWIIRLKKGVSSRCWEHLVLAILGEQFMLNDEICGAVISMRYAEDIISIWNRNSADTAITGYIRDTLRKILNLPSNTIMQYKPHNESLKDLSTTNRPIESSVSASVSTNYH